MRVEYEVHLEQGAGAEAGTGSAASTFTTTADGGAGGAETTTDAAKEGGSERVSVPAHCVEPLAVWRARTEAIKAAVGTESPCAVCGAPSVNRCSACLSVYYCSVACQRADWKAHKAACTGTAGKGKSKGSSAAAGASSSTLLQITKHGVPEGRRLVTPLRKLPVRDPAEKERDAKEGRSFIAKIQVPMQVISGSPRPVPAVGEILIQDEYREVLTWMRPEDPNWQRLMDAVQARPEFGGAKAYFVGVTKPSTAGTGAGTGTGSGAGKKKAASASAPMDLYIDIGKPVPPQAW